jgi:integrase
VATRLPADWDLGTAETAILPDEKAAEKHLAENSAKVSRGEYLDQARIPTFNDAAEIWYRSKTDRRPSCVADIRSRLDRHILPRIGTLKLDRITVGAIEEIRDDLRANDYAPRTINFIVRIVSAVFRAAIRRGEAVTNPVDRVERAFIAARELRPGEDEGASSDDSVSPDAVLNPAEVRAMLAETTPGLYRTLFTAAALTGERSGELFALHWGDVETLKSGPAYIDVRRTVSWSRLKGEEIRPRYFPPKTRSGIRKLPIPSELAAALRHWKVQCPATADDLVFPAADGRPNSPLECVALRIVGGAWACRTQTDEHALASAQLRERAHHGRRAGNGSSIIARPRQSGDHAKDLQPLVQDGRQRRRGPFEQSDPWQ